MKETLSMTSNISITLSDDTIDALGAAIAKHLNVDVAVSTDTGDTPKPAAKKTAAKKAASKKAEPEPEEAEDDDASEDDARREELEAMNVTALRKIAKGLGFDADQVKGADKDTLVEAILDDEAENADDDDEDPEDEDADEDGAEDDGDDDDDSEDGDDEEGEDYTREDLEAMSMRELRALAKEWEVTVPKGIDQDDLVDLLLGEESGDDEDEDGEEDGDSDEYTEADLKAMDLADLRELAKEWEVKVPKTVKTKAAIIKLLLS